MNDEFNKLRLAAARARKATAAFERALARDEKRYDAAVELANQYSYARRNGEAAELLGHYESSLDNSPMYLDLAGAVYTDIGLSQKAWPDARIVHLIRNPMDSYFSIYKQVVICTYKISYSLKGLGAYYVAYDRLRRHWQNVLKDRMIVVQYESLVSVQVREKVHTASVRRWTRFAWQLQPLKAHLESAGIQVE